jgi:hypothetical protein
LNPEVAETISSRAILCLKNIDFSASTTPSFSKCLVVSKSTRVIDTIDSEDPEDIANYPAQVPLMSLTFFPMHYISKLVHSSSFSRTMTNKGLCNGTRLILKNLIEILIVAEIASL